MKIKDLRKINKVLVSLFHKEPARMLIESLYRHGVELFATGGTFDYIASLNIPIHPVESLTAFPSILGGRVKTLHPVVFGGILARRDLQEDMEQAGHYNIPLFDMVVVDLYPFEDALARGLDHQSVIEKIDIGGISLIRAAAKNYHDVAVVPSSAYFQYAENLLETGQGAIGLDDRKKLAAAAFDVSSHYDTAIYHYLNETEPPSFKQSIQTFSSLRYGENPHQQACFYGDLNEAFDQLHGKALSYNNLLDVDAAFGLIREFDKPCFAVIKHTNVCGIALRSNLSEAWDAALAGDPVSAFGGVLIANRPVDEKVALAIDKLFFEVLIAPSFEKNALDVLTVRKNRILLISKSWKNSGHRFRSALNGVLWQTEDAHAAPATTWKRVTQFFPSEEQLTDLSFANIIAKHLKSNAIALVKNRQLIGIGAGQTSRVDALNHAIEKANFFGHSVKDAVMASDAFFPFPDCVEIAHKAGIAAIIQPGGSVKDQASIDYCNQAGMAMVFSGIRHFKH